MKILEAILIIVNAIFGLIQIFYALLYLEYLMSFSYVLVCIASFALGYYTIIKSRFTRLNAHLFFAVILLFGNLIFLTSLWFDIIVNSANSSILLDFGGFMIITFADFEELGNLFARRKGVNEGSKLPD